MVTARHNLTLRPLPGPCFSSLNIISWKAQGKSASTRTSWSHSIFYSPTIPIAEQSSHHCSQVKQEAQKAACPFVSPELLTLIELYQEVLAL